MNSRNEIVPLKWCKYLRLVEWGFVSERSLKAEIHRFQRRDENRLIADLERELAQFSWQGQKLYVVKLVPADLQGQLPNYRLTKTTDVKGLSVFLAKHASYNHVELWYCRTQIDLNIFSVAGRFLFSEGNGMKRQTVEQVWRCSPRLLQIYGHSFPYSYVRASRYDWGWSYSIEEVHCAAEKGNDSTTLAKEFAASMIIVERSRDRIEQFVKYLDSFSFAAYTLEYKIVGSRLSIIDWDTPDDRKVLMA